jgi:hypothetical protein
MVKFFGLRIILESEYQHYKKSDLVFSNVIQCHRWFAGWHDLDIIWEYILGKREFGGICETRHDYALARQTDVYGRSYETSEM